MNTAAAAAAANTTHSVVTISLVQNVLRDITYDLLEEPATAGAVATDPACTTFLASGTRLERTNYAREHLDDILRAMSTLRDPHFSVQLCRAIKRVLEGPKFAPLKAWIGRGRVEPFPEEHVEAAAEVAATALRNVRAQGSAVVTTWIDTWGSAVGWLGTLGAWNPESGILVNTLFIRQVAVTLIAVKSLLEGKDFLRTLIPLDSSSTWFGQAADVSWPRFAGNLVAGVYRTEKNLYPMSTLMFAKLVGSGTNPAAQALQIQHWVMYAAIAVPVLSWVGSMINVRYGMGSMSFTRRLTINVGELEPRWIVVILVQLLVAFAGSRFAPPDP